ncbi:MAG: N-acetyl-gamma-glutamyl-phosphate reductase [Candidatus Methanomethyliales bacterium]|nr:N-acetyl-gamma-glutamyl-phosphate reductase [Candidatus Methanomethylicales archaeon]
MKTVGIIGGSGYTGGELLRILINHPEADIRAVTSREHAGEPVFKLHPQLRKLTDLKFIEPDVEKIASSCEFVFLALPHGASAPVAKRLLESGIRVIDLSADFRLKNKDDYPKWYGWEHPCPELLEVAVFGLPEFHRDEIRNAKLVANPGCIATASILSAAPPIKAGMVEQNRVVLDAKIGSSGAGANVSEASHHPEHSNIVRAYKPVMHRHTAEIEQELSLKAGGERVTVALTPHAIDMVRGIMVTGHLFLSREVTMQELWRAYRELYQNEPFVRIVRDQKGLHQLPDPKNVVGSNFCDVGFELDPHAKRLVTFGAIDNLLKGAAGQAVQNFNLMIGVDERTGIKFAGVRPI